MARPLSDRTPGPLLLGGPAGAPPGGGALLGLRSLLQGNSKPKEPASCEFSSHCVRDSTVGGGGCPWHLSAKCPIFASLHSVT